MNWNGNSRVALLSFLLWIGSVNGCQPSSPQEGSHAAPTAGPMDDAPAPRPGTELGEIGHLAFLPNGKGLISSSPHVLILWDLEKGRMVRAMERGKEPGFWVGPLAVSADGKWLLGGIYFWDISSGKFVRSLPSRQQVSAVALSKDGNRALLGGTARNWDEYLCGLEFFETKTSKLIRYLDGAKQVIGAVAISPDENLALSHEATPDEKNTLRLWDLRSGKQLWSRDNSQEYRTANVLGFSEDGKYVFSRGKKIRKWTLAKGELLESFDKPAKNAKMDWGTIGYSPDGSLCVFEEITNSKVPFKRALSLWDVKSGKLLQVLKKDYFRRSFKVLFSPDGRLVAVGGLNHSLEIWDVTTGGFVWDLVIPHDFRFPLEVTTRP